MENFDKELVGSRVGRDEKDAIAGTEVEVNGKIYVSTGIDNGVCDGCAICDDSESARSNEGCPYEALIYSRCLTSFTHKE